MPTKNAAMGGQKKKLTTEEKEMLKKPVQEKKEKNTGKKVAIVVASALLAATTLTIPAVIYYTNHQDFQVEIHAVGEDLSSNQTLKLKKGSTIGDIQAPNKDGYFFAGFYSDQDLNNELSTDTKITKGTTVYLKYIIINYRFTNADAYENVEIQNLTGEKLDTTQPLHHGDRFAVKLTTKTGYDSTFSITGAELTNEYTNEGLPIYKIVADNKTAEDKDITIHYDEQIQTFTVHFFDFDGVEQTSQSVQYNNSITVETPHKESTTEEQFSFAGWLIVDENNQQIGEEKQYFDFSTPITANLYVRADFTSSAREYTLTIDAEDRSHVTIMRGEDDITELNTIRYGEELKISYNCDEGHHCLEFKINGESHLENNVTHLVKGNLNISFEQEINTYSVHFLDQDGEELADYPAQEVEHNNTTQINDPSKDPTTEQQYTFKGWLIVDESNQPILQDGENQYFDFSQAITSDLYVRADFTATAREYLLSIDQEDQQYIKVMRGGSDITSQTTIHYGEELTISYVLTDGAELVTFTINGEDYSKQQSFTYTVQGNVTIEFKEEIIYLNYTEVDGGWKVTGLNDSFGNNTKLIIPDTYQDKPVLEIDNDAFYGKTQITSVTIGSNVTSIGFYAFGECSLKSVYYTGTLKQWCETEISGRSNIHHESMDLYIHGQKIDGELVITADINKIDGYAFYKCSGLTSVAIPTSVTSIGESAFEGCSGLTSVTIPASVTSIGESAFEDCSGLTSVTISSGVTSIGESAFKDCSGLTSVTIPASVTSIGSYAFSGCSGLTSLTISNGVTNIGKYAFSGLTKLTKLEYDANITEGYESQSKVFKNLGKNSGGCEVIIGESVTNIPEYLFSNYYSQNDIKITKLTIGSNVTSIGDRAFYDCPGITTLTIPDSVTSIGEGAFSDLTKLTKLEYNANITENFRSTSNVFYNLGKNAGDGCEVIIGDNVTNIPAYLFSIAKVDFKCNITKLTIGNSVTTIGSYAFENCANLTSVTMGNNVNSIGSGAFHNCSSLTSITIPSSVTNLEMTPFSRCSQLTSVYYTGTSKQWCEITRKYDPPFENPYDLYIQNQKVENLILTGDISKINDYAFYKCSSITSVTIPEGVTSIGKRAFASCSNLTEINIESGDVYKGLTGSSTSDMGGLLYNISTGGIVRVKKSIIDDEQAHSSYLEDDSNFTKSNGDGEWAEYYVFTKK